MHRLTSPKERNINLQISIMIFFAAAFWFATPNLSVAQKTKAELHFEVSVPEAQSHSYEVDFYVSGINRDTIVLKMPKWMPGYYQILDYANNVSEINATAVNGQKIPIQKLNKNSWYITNQKNKAFSVHYKIKAERSFVALSFVDAEHAYIAPANTFLYIENLIQCPVSVKINPANEWSDIATGLQTIIGKNNEFSAPDFDILYDCPILIGNLEELPSFTVQGIEHRFIGYKLGDFDKISFVQKLKKVVEAATDLMGDIPYKKYTFIAIGPGQGGIEHLNNTTISFDGNSLRTTEAINRTLSFIGHEYFHHYNVKRIRPFELGPFDYDKINRTNQLWISEGLTVYYQNMLMKHAGLADKNTLLSWFENEINAVENDNGRFFQSLAQSSYYTWEDGPFGTSWGEEDHSITYYQKGPVVGLLLNFAIRNASQNKKSLDDVMRLVYREYYQKQKRGFTEAEFQQVCESIAGSPLTAFFEYIYTTKELDYKKYLGYAGLELTKTPEKSFKISQVTNPSKDQKTILKSWLGE
ncbi:M61 family peptidase [Maribellus comscasis]|uniref:M61 family peptidase n=1 Tax=Maribellus comscasis TaxID=2681766 RepID=A0A6I6JMI5_9BACT|nr:M61 family peptidase [Maribellus comscasis]QGY42268.1 M61 family peptidase [Maribellus comscasis]